MSITQTSVLTRARTWVLIAGLSALLVAIGAARTLAAPSMGALLPQLVVPRQLASAQAWLISSGQLASISGPALAGVLLALVAAVAVVWVVNRQFWFVGTDDAGQVTLYRGLPYELPLGIDLYTRDYTSGVTIDQVPASRRATFTNHKLRSNSDAQDLVRQLETGELQAR